MKVKKSRPILRLIQIGSLLVFAVAVYIGYEITRPLDIPVDKIYVLEQGESVMDLARTLEGEGFVAHDQLVVWVARLGQIDRKFKAGEYRFTPDQNLLEVFDQIVQGKSITHSIKFIEGWTLNDFLNELNSKSNIERTLTEATYDEVLNALEIPAEHPEGWFFPDTYNYTSGQSDTVILSVAYKKMLETLDQEWANRRADLPYDSKYESLIVASIIQKETYISEEYPIIGGVIVNRLRKGMRLQMDPTVIYGLGGVEGRLRKSDLAKDTPYNTYTRYGLPPTPIAMPGQEALRAAANPADTTAFYFVSQGDGTHKFSDTIEEHIEAVQAYRKMMNQ